MASAKSSIITIDGPAASGKSSVSRELAKRLGGWSWVSTGSFYRGLGYVAQEMKTNLEDAKALAALATSDVWDVKMTPEQTVVLFKGQDVTAFTNREDVGSIASRISHYPEVRAALLAAQRKCSEGVVGLVAEGRDCGTVVFPQAEVKIYLTARGESRASRRASEHGEDPSRILEAQKVRDAQDSSRKVAPLAVPENALVVDTSDLDFLGVVEKVEAYVRENLP